MINIFTITRIEFFILVTTIIVFKNFNLLYEFLYKRNKASDIKLKNRFMLVMYKIYIVLLCSIVYFPVPITIGENTIYKSPRFYLIPWQSTIRMYNRYGIDKVIINIGGNLILLTPFLFFICYFSRKIKLKDIIIIAFSISLFIESTQVILSYIIPNLSRAFDVMDLICNTISGIIGYYLYEIYMNIKVNKNQLSDEKIKMNF